MMRYETADSCGYEFDYQADFRQFLEEARNQKTLNTTNLEPEPVKKQIDWQKKNRKSWKNSLFSWLKTDKRTKPTNQQTKSVSISKPRCGHASGPVQETTCDLSAARAKKPASGPLTGLFSSTRRAEEYEVPYMCLGQLNNSQKIHSYGPVYLVT